MPATAPAATDADGHSLRVNVEPPRLVPIAVLKSGLDRFGFVWPT
jgi:hypothetical protein